LQIIFVICEYASFYNCEYVPREGLRGTILRLYQDEDCHPDEE